MRSARRARLGRGSAIQSPPFPSFISHHSMESLSLAHHGVSVHVGLFSPITNAAALRARLVAASQLPQDAEGDAERARLDFAFVDGAMVSSRFFQNGLQEPPLTLFASSFCSRWSSSSFLRVQSSPRGYIYSLLSTKHFWRTQKGL